MDSRGIFSEGVMAKKNKFSIKDIQIYIVIGSLAVGLITTFIKLSISAENTKIKVEELAKDVKEIADEGDKKIEELKDKSKETEKKVEVNKTQQDNIQAQVQQVSEKTDKIYDLLLEIDKKKK